MGPRRANADVCQLRSEIRIASVMSCKAIRLPFFIHMHTDHTHDASRRSWLASANVLGTDFPIQNLPFSVVRRAGSSEAFRCAVAIGDSAIDMVHLAQASCFEPELACILQACAQPRLNELMALGPLAWQRLRHALFAFLEDGATGESVEIVREALLPLCELEYSVPATIGDYTDFYTSYYHAHNVGTLIRPEQPIAPNFFWLPIAYHGRVSSIGVSGTPIRRPFGQSVPPGKSEPIYTACAMLDYELELGVFVGQATKIGHPAALDAVDQHIFGLCLLNDWSARDVQWWEMAPLGPFLAKNFATTISPWIVTLEALAPYRVAWSRAKNEPQPLRYLESENNRKGGALDIRLQVTLQSAAQRQTGRPATLLSETSFRHQYWSIGQMLTHHTSGGCPLNVGDLIGSGTISGPLPNEAGALVELSRGGRQPVELGNGEKRSFLADGDIVTLRGWCDRSGFVRIGFGDCYAEVLPSLGQLANSD